MTEREQNTSNPGLKVIRFENQEVLYNTEKVLESISENFES